MTDVLAQGATDGAPVVLVPGYELLDVLGVGAGGPVWRARSLDVGSPPVEVAVKVVVGGVRAERELAVLRGVRHPHVVRLLDVVPLADGCLALVLELVEGGTLAQLVRARGHLRPGEVVTLVAPLASALADMHRLGVQHGDLAPGNVLVDRDGRPRLSDLGTVRITGVPREEHFGTPGYVDPAVIAGGPAGTTGDVYGLGALAWFALTGATPPAAVVRPALREVLPGLPSAMVEVVERALDPDPARRPDAATLARDVYDAAAAEPLWLVGLAPVDGGLTHRIRRLAAADEAEKPRHRADRPDWRRRNRRAVLTALTCVVLVALIACAAVALLAGPGGGRRDAPHAVPVVEPTVAAAAAAATMPIAGAAPVTDAVRPGGSAAVLSDEEARAVLDRVSARRARAFAGADPGVLSDVTLPGSPADRQARAAVTGLRSRGFVYRGVRLRVVSVHVSGPAAQRPGGVVLDATTDVSAYDVVDRDRHVRRHVAARAGTTSRLVIVPTSAGWRVAEVLR